MTASFDVVVLGAGSGGYAAALRAAQLGLSVALVEKDQVGGTCLHRGCIPTKAILHAAEVADAARDGSQFGVHATINEIDLDGVTAYADSVVTRLHKGLTGLISARGITVVNGAGRLVDGVNGPPAVQVDNETYAGRYLVLASGSYSRTVPGIEVNGTSIVTSDQAIRLSDLPRTAVVLGGGVIGVEFASAWRSFGVEVTVIEALPGLVTGEEPEVSAALERAFKKRKIRCLTGAVVESVDHTDIGVSVRLADGKIVEADLMLVAVGRGPATDEQGYDESGIRRDHGFVAVTDRLETSVGSVFAVGDIVLGAQLAHRGFAHGLFVAEEIAHRTGALPAAPTVINETTIPRVTYCDPEIASVGLSEAAARSAFGDVETLTYDLGGNGKSQILKTQGFVKLIRVRNGPVLGVHMIGSRVAELVGEAQLIAGWEGLPEDVAPLVHAHPTQNEALGEAHLALAGKPLHSHR